MGGVGIHHHKLFGRLQELHQSVAVGVGYSAGGQGIRGEAHKVTDAIELPGGVVVRVVAFVVKWHGHENRAAFLSSDEVCSSDEVEVRAAPVNIRNEGETARRAGLAGRIVVVLIGIERGCGDAAGHGFKGRTGGGKSLGAFGIAPPCVAGGLQDTEHQYDHDGRYRHGHQQFENRKPVRENPPQRQPAGVFF